MRCIFCCEEKDTLTDEHIIPKALASNFLLKRASCHGCQTRCNSSFEQHFLKGSNFISMIRAQLGLRGRRNAPIFGFDQHGHPLNLEVQAGFPPIRLGLGAAGFYRPPQVILIGADKTPISYSFLPDTLSRPIVLDFFDTVVNDVPEAAVGAAFWADGDLITANGWRDLLETFVAWANRRKLLAMASCIAAGNAAVNFTLDWSVGYRDRGLSKIAFTYLLSVLDESRRFGREFEPMRQYILNGKIDSLMAWSGPVFQLQLLPTAFPAGLRFTYLLATVRSASDVYVLIQLHTMGLFCVKLNLAGSDLEVPDTLMTFDLDKVDDNYIMRSTSHTGATLVNLASGVHESLGALG